MSAGGSSEKTREALLRRLEELSLERQIIEAELKRDEASATQVVDNTGLFKSTLVERAGDVTMTSTTSEKTALANPCFKDEMMLSRGDGKIARLARLAIRRLAAMSGSAACRPPATVPPKTA